MQQRMLYPVLFSFAVFVASLSAGTTQAPNVTAADREALAAVVQELDASYNAQDAARLSAVFAEDGNFQFPVESIVMRGREEIRRHFARQFAASPPLRHVTTTGDLTFIAPAILAVDIQVDILAVDTKTGAAQTLFHYGGLGLGIRKDSGWRIRLVRLFPVTK
jgi:uncharacterized protein (TIGR02246 family)